MCQHMYIILPSVISQQFHCCKFFPHLHVSLFYIVQLCFGYFQEILEGVTDIDLVVNLKLREDVLLAKCLGRRICSDCGGNYNIACIDIKGANGIPRMYMAPLLPPPHCASKLITRSDDTEPVVKERLRVYNEMVLPFSLCVFLIHFETNNFLIYARMGCCRTGNVLMHHIKILLSFQYYLGGWMLSHFGFF